MDQQKIRDQLRMMLAQIHPGLFLRYVHCVDNTTGDSFRFHFSPEQLIKWASTPNEITKLSIPEDKARQIYSAPYEETGWEWQGDLIDWWIRSDITLILKARQLGITWCAAGVALWYLLNVPGVRILVQSKTEPDAADVIDHVWEMYQSLSGDLEPLRNGVKILKPSRQGSRPYLDIEVEHQDGRVTKLNAMASTEGAGHGATAAFVILDEFSRHPYARGAYKAVVPAQGGSKLATGKTAIISTANGISVDEESGNYYHHLWSNAELYGIRTKFLRWDANPGRDKDWYERVPRKLPAKDRGEQYPENPTEAFILTGDAFFDVESLKWYGENAVEKPARRGDWIISPEGRSAIFSPQEFGPITIYREPDPTHLYAIGADIATGRGKDASAAYVIDLSTYELVCEFHGKIDPDMWAAKLHFLGKMYGTASKCESDAKLAIEMGGGYGEPVLIALRDGKNGRPPYPNLYRHRHGDQVDATLLRGYGMPMTPKTRALVIGNLTAAIREKDLPFMTEGLLSECLTFVHASTNPSPRAADGCNDDRVMAAGITLEMFRLFGHHPNRYTSDRPEPNRDLYKVVKNKGWADRRYPKGA